jgi:hypothetical protein
MFRGEPMTDAHRCRLSREDRPLLLLSIACWLAACDGTIEAPNGSLGGNRATTQQGGVTSSSGNGTVTDRGGGTTSTTSMSGGTATTSVAGGASGVGGSAADGTTTTGGVVGSGGGSVRSNGSSGGSTATGGTSATGGAATGGLNATGGKVATGGAANGGTANGGTANGGTANGGVSTAGNKATGGVSAGGKASGGGGPQGGAPITGGTKAVGGNSAIGGAAGAAGTSCPFQGHVSYTLAKSASPTVAEQAAYDKITPAMDTAIRFYNCYTNINKALNVSYNSSVATADGNINGSIRFGSTASMNHVTAMHEVSHTIGIGTASNWGTFVVNGKFTGTNANAQLLAIPNRLDDTIGADNQHFWPYGLNYESEGQHDSDLVGHCQMVMAIRKDLGMS